MLSTSYDELLSGQDFDAERVENIEVLLAKMGVINKHGVKNGIKNNWLTKAGYKAKVVDTVQFIADLGQFVETWSKVVGYMTRLKSLKKGKISMQELAYEVRNYAGSPDFLTRGTWTPYTNKIFLFSNAMISGTRAEIHGAFRDPRTKLGYKMKMCGLVVAPTLMAAGAANGLFGEEIQRMYNRISEYDKTNYHCIVLGEDENGRTIYWRIPVPHFARMIKGILWKGLMKEADTGVFRAMGDIVAPMLDIAPGLSPTIELMTKWGEYFGDLIKRNNKPIYSSSGRRIVSKTEMQAANTFPMESLRKMTKFTLAMSNIRLMENKKNKSQLQLVIEKMPVASSFVRFSKTDREIKDIKMWQEYNQLKAERSVERQIDRRR